MSPHLKNNQIPYITLTIHNTRFALPLRLLCALCGKKCQPPVLHNKIAHTYHPATHGAFLCKLLTLNTICIWLTKVNKIIHKTLINRHLDQTHVNPQLTQKPHYLTKNHLFISVFYSLLLA